jgi:hypothetical protein
MIKGWNHTIGDAFVGFYLELMTIDILTGITISDFPTGVRYVLDKGREKIKFKQKDPAGFGGHINPLKNAKTVQEAVLLFEAEYQHAVQAEVLAAGNRIPAAIAEWGDIFGSYFPAYG